MNISKTLHYIKNNMKGYIFTENGVYYPLKIQIGKTYEMVGVSDDTSMGFGFFINPDDIFRLKEYKKDITKIFKIKPLGNVKENRDLVKYTNMFTVLDEISTSDYKKIFKNYVFDDEFHLIEEINENKTYEYVNGKLTLIKVHGDTDTMFYYDDKGNLIHYDAINYQEWYDYDDKCRLIHMKDSIVSERFYQYDENNNCIYVRLLPSNREYYHTYDDRGNLILQKDNFGHDTYAQYDMKNNIINVKTNGGEEGNFKYDDNNNLIEYFENIPSRCFKILIK